MARKKITKKPVRRRAAARKTGSPLGKIGWMAAAVLAVGWIASDGRAVSYVGHFMPRTETPVAATVRPAAVREASLRTTTAPELRVPASERPPAAYRPARPPAVVPTHVAAIAPSPAPRLAPMRMPRDPVVAAEPRQPAAAMLPPMRPQALAAPAERPPVPAPMTAAVAPTGGLRHATRLLVMRDSPDEAGKHIGSVVSGMQVEVLKAAGHWRYVRSQDDEGWVDGSFLAGESAALETSAPRTILAAMPDAPAALAAAPAPVPPMAISSR